VIELVTTTRKRENRRPLTSLGAARAAWLTTIACPGEITEARVVEQDGKRQTEHCFWDRGGFTDRTPQHLAELRGLAEALTASAPAGYALRIEGDRVVFTGGSRGEASILAAASSQERVLAHWQSCLPSPSAGIARFAAPARPETTESATAGSTEGA
jgi:hypothetical protein